MINGKSDKRMSCQHVYLREIHEQSLADYVKSSRSGGPHKVRKKGEVCGRALLPGVTYCDIHPPIVIDTQVYFPAFVEWVDKDPVITWKDLSFPLQMTLYKAFKKILNSIRIMREELGIAENEIDLSEQEYQLALRNGKREQVKRYYQLLTLDLRQAFEQMEYRGFERKYKDYYKEWPMIPIEPEPIPKPIPKKRKKKRI